MLGIGTQQVQHSFERHAKTTQVSNQFRIGHLFDRVAPVAGCRIDRRWHQHASFVIEAQRTDRQAAATSELADPKKAVHLTIIEPQPT